MNKHDKNIVRWQEQKMSDEEDMSVEDCKDVEPDESQDHAFQLTHDPDLL